MSHGRLAELIKKDLPHTCDCKLEELGTYLDIEARRARVVQVFVCLVCDMVEEIGFVRGHATERESVHRYSYSDALEKGGRI